MEVNKKLLISDMDGTLLNSNHRLSEKTLEAIKLLKENNYDLILCSGRCLSSVEYISKHFATDYMCIGNNGAIASVNEEIILDYPIERSILKQIIDIATEKGYTFHMYDRDTLYSNVKVESRLKHLKDDEGNLVQVKDYYDENIYEYIKENDIKIYKFMFHGDFSNDPDLIEFLDGFDSISYSMSGLDSADVYSSKADKWQTSMELVKIIGKDYNEIVAIGDYDNDLPMIKNANIGIAMGNALDSVKVVADFITDSNDEEGFNKAIEKLLEVNKNA